MIKSFIEITDKIFKSIDENIEYPILTNPDIIDSQKAFLSDIISLKDIDQSISEKSIKQGICPPLKIFLIETFDLIESTSEFKPNENDFFTSGEDSSVLSINNNNDQTNLHKYKNKIKDSIDFIGNKYVTKKNIKFIEKEVKNLVHRSDESKIYRSIHTNVKELKNKLNENKDYQEIKQDVKDIFRSLFKK